MKKMNVLKPEHRLPIFIEFCWEKVNTEKPFIVVIFNFLRVIKRVQNLCRPPIVALMTLATPSQKAHNKFLFELKRETSFEKVVKPAC
jgi:hypothetical protein